MNNNDASSSEHVGNHSIQREDQIDLNAIKLTQDFESILGVKKALHTVPVRKPTKQEFVRVHPGEDFQIRTAVIEFKDDNETFLVDKSMQSELAAEIVPKIIFTVINRQNVVFLWPVRLPSDDGRLDEWNRSALKAARTAMAGWIRIASNRSLGAYEVYDATAPLPEPEWPEQEFAQLLAIAFADKIVRSPDHPVARRLRGEI